MIGAGIGLIAAISGAGISYGQNLLDTLHRRDPRLTAATMTAARPQGPPLILSRRWSGHSKSSASRTLFDASGKAIGTIVFETRCPQLHNGDDLASEVSRRIYSAGSLTEPSPFIAGVIRAPRAQAMIDDALDKDPSIITLAFHVTPPGQRVNAIVASSFGRIGKPADSDDLGVIEQNRTVRETTNVGERLAIELPLLDSRKRIIGALSTSFRMAEEEDAERIEKRAVALRDSLSRQTPSISALFRPITVSRQVRALPACRP